METEKNKKLNGDTAEQKLSAADTHLSSEEITAYRYGNFSSPEIEHQMQNHLIDCRRCTNLLLELNSFAAESANDSLTAENTHAQWEKFEKKLAAQPETFNQIAAQESEPKTKDRFAWFSFFNLKPSVSFAAFVILIFGAIFSAFFFATRNSETDSASITHNSPPTIGNTISPNRNVGNEPKNENSSTIIDNDNAANRKIPNQTNKNTASQVQDNFPPSKKINKSPKTNTNTSKPVPNLENKISPENEVAQNRIDVSLYPEETLRGGAADKRIIRVNQNLVEQIRLKLNAPKSDNVSDYSIEIIDSQNKTVLTLPILPDKRGDFYLPLPLVKFPPDDYSLKIYAEKNNVRSLFYTYQFGLIYE